jgi:hypothetical protein
MVINFEDLFTVSCHGKELPCSYMASTSLGHDVAMEFDGLLVSLPWRNMS